jgi:hypothetical protein
MARKPGPKKKRGPKPKSIKKIGRPTKMSEETIQKLEEVFALGGTDLEACFYADISRRTLYTYQNENPDFLYRKELLKQKPFLLARQSIMKGVKEDYNFAMTFAERKMPEFKRKVEIESPLVAEQSRINILINNLNLNEKDFERENASETLKMLAERIIEQGTVDNELVLSEDDYSGAEIEELEGKI